MRLLAPSFAVTLTLVASPPVVVSARVAPDTTSEETGPDDETEGPVDERALQEATRRFQQGFALFSEGDFDRALFEFENAYRITRDARLLYNIGVTQLETHDYAGAQRSLQSYLDEAGPQVDEARRQEVLDQLETLVSRVGTVEVFCNVDRAVVSVDGETVGQTPLGDPVVLNIGRHRVEVAADGYQTARRELEVSGGKRTGLDFELEVAPTPEPVPPPVVVDATSGSPAGGDHPDTRRLRIATWSMLGVTGALGAGSIVTGVLALSAQGDLDDALDQRPGDPSDISNEASRRDLLALTTDALLGATALAALVTIGLGVTIAVRQKRARTAASRSGSRWAIVPTGGIGGFGARFGPS